MDETALQLAHPTKQRMIAGLALYGTISSAARHAGCSRNAHYLWLDDPEYAAAVAQAQAEHAERLEQEMYRRAVEGVEEPWTLDKDGQPLMRRKYSDTLLIFALKGALPHKYSEKAQSLTVNGDVTTVNVTADALIVSLIAAGAAQNGQVVQVLEHELGTES